MGHPPIEQPYYATPYPDPGDPLVNQPGVGLAGWIALINATLKRSWRSIISIILLTQIFPLLAFLALAGATGIAAFTAHPLLTGSGGELAPGVLGGALVLAFVLALLLIWLQAVGWAAGTWTVVREAVHGYPMPLVAALRFGLANSKELFGFYLLGGLAVLLGLIACVLPGLYAMAGFALLGPIWLFERQGVSASFQALHRNAGMVLGRVLLIAVPVWIASSLPDLVAPFLGAVPTDPLTELAVTLVTGICSALLTLPAASFQLVAVIVTYAEQRARLAPLTTARLAAELG